MKELNMKSVVKLVGRRCGLVGELLVSYHLYMQDVKSCWRKSKVGKPVPFGSRREQGCL